MYDVIIIGAGPSGATLARFLDKRFRVLLIDKRNLDTSDPPLFSKCCGGLLAPDAQNILADLGLGVPKRYPVWAPAFQCPRNRYGS